MFHRNRHNNDSNSSNNGAPRRGFFHRGRSSPHPSSYGPGPNGAPVGPYTGYGQNRGFYRDPYYEGSTRSDWDHYAVRHEEALIGDPLPVMNNNLNLASRAHQANMNSGPYGPGPLGNGPLNNGFDDSHYDKRHPAPSGYDKRGNPLIGPVTANGPLAGNYSSGTVVERNLVQGPGRRTRSGWVDDNTGGQQWGSTAWGSEPLYGSSSGGWGNQPLYGYRDARDVATPLLPDNPWTHNELGRDYSDAYRRGTMAYSSVNNAFVQPPITENYVTYGPNGERIEGTRTRVIREEIAPPVGALGQSSTTQTSTIVKDEIIPVSHTHSHDVINVQGLLVEDRVTRLPGGGTAIKETTTPVTVTTAL